MKLRWWTALLLGAAFIGLSFYDSVRHNRRQAALARPQ
jgi:hypothetical protein